MNEMEILNLTYCKYQPEHTTLNKSKNNTWSDFSIRFNGQFDKEYKGDFYMVINDTYNNEKNYVYVSDGETINCGITECVLKGKVLKFISSSDIRMVKIKNII